MLAEQLSPARKACGPSATPFFGRRGKIHLQRLSLPGHLLRISFQCILLSLGSPTLSYISALQGFREHWLLQAYPPLRQKGQALLSLWAFGPFCEKLYILYFIFWLQNCLPPTRRGLLGTRSTEVRKNSTL